MEKEMVSDFNARIYRLEQFYNVYDMKIINGKRCKEDGTSIEVELYVKFVLKDVFKLERSDPKILKKGEQKNDM